MLDLNVSTIFFQTLNFFILLGILRYFLYRPLLQVMRQREEAIAARVRDAEERGEKADAERQALAVETARVHDEAEQILAAARAEAAESRAKLLDGARQEAAQRIESAKQFATEQERIAWQQLAEHITGSAVTIAGDLIRAAAGPTVHVSLIERLVDDFLGLPPQRLELLRQAGREKDNRITLELAFPPTDKIGQQLTAAIGRTLGMEATDLRIEFRVNPALIAGARILVGTMAVDLSLVWALEEVKDRARPDQVPANVMVTR